MRRRRTIQKTFGRRVAELRRAQGFTQETFAEKLRMHVPNLAKIEQGRGNPTLDTIARFADALGVDPILLFKRPRTLEVRIGRPPKRRG